MKKALSLLLVLVLVFAMAACGNTTTPGTETNSTNPAAPADPGTSGDSTPSDNSGKSVGFVTFGMGGEFFEQLANTYQTTMEAEGWTAYYADGKFDPTTQIEAAENYIAMGVDVLVIWSISPGSMSGVIDQAMEAGIKVIAFVAETEKYDVLMRSDDEELAANLNKLAAKWIDETFANAPDHSIPVAAINYRGSETTAIQSDVLIRIEEYSTKAKFVKEVEASDETVPQGQTIAENLYLTNPEIKVFLTPDNPIATGIESYYTSIGSPVTDYSDMGIFCINGNASHAESIVKSITNENPMRGTVMTGSVQDTANDLRDMIVGITDGTVEEGWVQRAGTLFVNADTAEEYLETGTVTSLTAEDFE